MKIPLKKEIKINTTKRQVFLMKTENMYIIGLAVSTNELIF